MTEEGRRLGIARRVDQAEVVVDRRRVGPVLLVVDEQMARSRPLLRLVEGIGDHLRLAGPRSLLTFFGPLSSIDNELNENYP